MFFQCDEKHLLTDNKVSGISWALVTYVGVGPLICPWAGERDEFMAPLVDHKTANCRGGQEQEQWCLEKGGEMGERVPEIQRQMDERSVIRLKYSVSLLTDMRRASRERGPDLVTRRTD